MIQTFQEAKKYLISLIPPNSPQLYPGGLGLKRTKYFLELLGSPQNKLQVIHITGTSGKGSTAYLISSLLQGQGQSVGLSISPHIVDIRERFQVNNAYISEEDFVKYLNELIPFIEKVQTSELGSPTYFEVITVLAFYIFHKLKLDYAVMEVGMGGWYDATNVVENKNKVAVLTKIGLDHMHILGNTISKIAYQKAKIIHEGNTVLSIDQKPQAQAIIDQIAREESAKVTYVTQKNYKVIRVSEQGTQFRFVFNTISTEFTTNLVGSYQAENASLALAVLYTISQRDGWKVDTDSVSHSLSQINIPGRMQILKVNGKTIIIDGAHNPQKMAAFIKNLKNVFPDRKFDFLLAFKRNKEVKEMLPYITPIARKINVTTFSTKELDHPPMPIDPQLIQTELNRLDFSDVVIISDPDSAYEAALSQTQELLVITGSFYLISQIHRKITAVT